MKHLAALVLVILLAFTGQELFAQKNKPAYELPAQMSPAVKAEYEKICDKGLILYNIHCGGCHTKKKGRKEIIPDFDQAKLAGYEIRVANPQHTSHIEEDRLTTEELVLIVTFLNYKTKSGYNLKWEKTAH